jgi:hypothetical protein
VRRQKCAALRQIRLCFRPVVQGSTQCRGRLIGDRHEHDRNGAGRIAEKSPIKGTPAAILGRIKAADAESAVREWIEKFGITDPEQQQRLVARPVK